MNIFHEIQTRSRFIPGSEKTAILLKINGCKWSNRTVASRAHNVFHCYARQNKHIAGGWSHLSSISLQVDAVQFLRKTLVGTSHRKPHERSVGEKSYPWITEDTWFPLKRDIRYDWIDRRVVPVILPEIKSEEQKAYVRKREGETAKPSAIRVNSVVDRSINQSRFFVSIDQRVPVGRPRRTTPSLAEIRRNYRFSSVALATRTEDYIARISAKRFEIKYRNGLSRSSFSIYPSSITP